MSAFQRQELAHLVWRNLRVRVSPRVPVEELEQLLSLQRDTTPQHEINRMRDQIKQFVTENRDRLSLFCDGNCYNHTDGVVVACYLKFLAGQQAAQRVKQVEGA